MVKISDIDNYHLGIIRMNVKSFIKELSVLYDKNGTILLDVAPQDYIGAKEFFVKTIVKTLDINPEYESDYSADICMKNSDLITDNMFDYVLLTEVLEHTLNPFSAIKEIGRILKKSGLLFLTVPFNFRIHGPLPDCWRFTEYGLRTLLKNFRIINIQSIETANRDLMPIQYKIIASKT